MPMSLEEAKCCITLLLTTCPHPCRLRKLLRDFRRLKGHNMPLFGFESHLDLLKSLNDIVVVLDSGHERNPEIRLIRREPPPPPPSHRAQDTFPGLEDVREIESYLSQNEPVIHNPTTPNVLIFQDQAAAYAFPPEPPSYRKDAGNQLEEFGLIDDGIGAGMEEEEHLEGVWDIEQDFSASFLMRLCLHWLLEGFKVIWRWFTRSIGIPNW